MDDEMTTTKQRGGVAGEDTAVATSTTDFGEKTKQQQQQAEKESGDCHPSHDPLDPVKALSFPAKLHAILSRRDYNDIVSWMPHGRSWRVHQPERFEIQVIPEFFVHCKYSSFIRQANGWGFRRVTKGPDRNSYYHEHFLRGRLHLCRHMRRSAPKDKISSGGSRAPPDFYKMSEEDPLPEQCDEDGEIAKVSDSSEAATAAGMTVVTRRNMARRLSSLSNKARGALDRVTGDSSHQQHKRQLALVSTPQHHHRAESESAAAAVETSKCPSAAAAADGFSSPIERAARAIEDHQRRRASILAAEHAAAVTAASTERRQVVASMGIDPMTSAARMAKAAVAASASSSTVPGSYDQLLGRSSLGQSSVLSRLSSVDTATTATRSLAEPDTSYGRQLLESYTLSRRLSGPDGGAAPTPSAHATARALLGYPQETTTPLLSARHQPPLPAASASSSLEAAAAAVAASGLLRRHQAPQSSSSSLGGSLVDPTLLGLGGRGAGTTDGAMDYLDLLRASASGAAANGYRVDEHRNNEVGGGLPPPLPRHWAQQRRDGRF